MKKQCLLSMSVIGGLICLTVFSFCGCRQTKTAPAVSEEQASSTLRASPPIQTSLSVKDAETYFKEIDDIVKKDDGKLWGKSLKTPFLFVDSETGDVIANEPDQEGILHQEGDFYFGKFPEDSIVANSVTTLGNKKYAMVRWDEYDDKVGRNVLFIHEQFHYHQPDLGLGRQEGMDPQNNHLDDREGRIYLRLEWAALNQALNSTEQSEQRSCIKDALAFREYRRELYRCGEEENELLILEGLAEYTGIALSADTMEERLTFLNQIYESRLKSDSFVRSFAYYSGPAYGCLLDQAVPGWNQGLTYNSDLGDLLAAGCGIEVSSADVDSRRDVYGYDKIFREENERKIQIDKQLNEYEDRLIKGAVIIINLTEPNIGFDPSNLMPYQDLGTIYPHITIIDKFGSLELTEGGCLLAKDWKSAVISAEGISIDDRTITGDGFSIRLEPEATIVKDGENYRIE